MSDFVFNTLCVLQLIGFSFLFMWSIERNAKRFPRKSPLSITCGNAYLTQVEAKGQHSILVFRGEVKVLVEEGSTVKGFLNGKPFAVEAPLGSGSREASYGLLDFPNFRI